MSSPAQRVNQALEAAFLPSGPLDAYVRHAIVGAVAPLIADDEKRLEEIRVIISEWMNQEWGATEALLKISQLLK